MIGSYLFKKDLVMILKMVGTLNLHRRLAIKGELSNGSFTDKSILNERYAL